MTRQDSAGSPQDLVLAARRAGVTDDRVLAAVAATPRTGFVPPGRAGSAYRDEPVPIPHGQVTTQPSLSALMIAALGLAGQERVLEVGTGYGYQAALLARLARQVVTIEIWPELAAQARRNLHGTGIGNVLVIAGDGTQGYPGLAPYDAVIVSAAFPSVPPPLVGQLRDGGRLVQPIGPGGQEQVIAFERQGASLQPREVITSASFVRLRGTHGYHPGDI